MDVRHAMKLATLCSTIGVAGFCIGRGTQTRAQGETLDDKKPPALEVFEERELLERQRKEKRVYLPFLGRSTLSCGIYTLPKGAKDGQSPHALDEVYYVLKGKAKFEVGSGEEKKTVAVRPGSILFVAAHEPHGFLDLQEELSLLVFFSNVPVPKKKEK